MLNKTPTQDLLAGIREIFTQDEYVTEEQRIRLIMLGREIWSHPEFADMSYVESKTAYYQLDRGRRTAYETLTSYISNYRTADFNGTLEECVDMIAVYLMADSTNRL